MNTNEEALFWKYIRQGYGYQRAQAKAKEDAAKAKRAIMKAQRCQ